MSACVDPGNGCGYMEPHSHGFACDEGCTECPPAPLPVGPDDLTTRGVLRCPVAMGPAGDDSRRCERDALPLHRTHLVGEVHHLPANEADVRAGALAWITERVDPARDGPLPEQAGGQ